jgi:DtxR family Mn-dependent transcriptional regulator
MKKKTDPSTKIKNEDIISESFEEYIENIYRLSLRNPGGWVKNKEISEKLNVKAPSVTNMLEKLKHTGYVDWTPRAGIRLTDLGRQRAKELVMNHIIVELFLERILKIKDPELIGKIACDFEHHVNPDISNALKTLLDFTEIKNVDNFILEDRFPSHIPTRSVFPERKVVDLFNDFEQELQKLFPSEENQGKIHSILTEFIEKKIITK